MEMLTPEAELILSATDGQMRKLKRVEYDRLAAEGYFEDEKVELLFGMVIPMSPIDPAHGESVHRLSEILTEQLTGRARVRVQSSFAASDESEPEPDIDVIGTGRYWTDHPQRSFLIVEVAHSSLRRDRAKRSLYGRADVDEYWIVNHIDDCVEVYRDRANGTWRTTMILRRGETIAPLAFPDVRIEVSEILPPA